MEIRRLAAADMLVTRPPYIDALGLMEVFDLLEGSPMILAGPKGTGKTMACEAWAADHNYLVVQFGCTEGTREKHLYGSIGIQDGSAFFTLGALTTAIDAANEIAESDEYAGVMLRLDEVNSLTPQMQKGLNSFADWQKSVAVPSIGRVFRVKPDTKLWVIGTMNPSAHGGVFDLNEDLKSRFRPIWVPYPDPEQEQIIVANVLPKVKEEWVSQLLDVAAQTRQGENAYPLSTRDVVQCLEDAQRMGMDRALKILSYQYDEGTDRDTFHTRVLGKTTIDLAATQLMRPPANLTKPVKAGVNRRSSL